MDIEDLGIIEKYESRTRKRPWQAYSEEGQNKRGTFLYSICRNNDESGHHECVGTAMGTTEEEAAIHAGYMAACSNVAPELLAKAKETEVILRAYESFHLDVRKAIIAWHSAPEDKAMDTSLDVADALTKLRDRLPERPGHTLREWEEGK